MIAYAVGPDGQALALAADASAAASALDMTQDSSAGPSFPIAAPDRPYRAAVLRFIDGRVERTVLPEVRVAFPHLQPLPNGEILLAGSRSARYRDGTHDLNGHVYGADGVLRRAFLVGDGIEDVQTTADGRIWVSYFDEGVYGNCGWEEPGGPSPIGSPGLIRWSAEGAIEWEYEAPPGVGPIDDGDVLNVADDAVWACYYSDFPLVRIGSDDSVTVWRTPLSAPGALAIANDVMMVPGGQILALRAGEVVELGSARIRLPSGAPIATQTVVGRGPYLHVFEGHQWYRLHVPDASIGSG